VGFAPVGVLREVGHKFGGWVDTALWQRMHPGGG
jgi:L-amino acid N-acyltransferase YncA